MMRGTEVKFPRLEAILALETTEGRNGLTCRQCARQPGGAADHSKTYCGKACSMLEMSFVDHLCIFFKKYGN